MEIYSMYRDEQYRIENDGHVCMRDLMRHYQESEEALTVFKQKLLINEAAKSSEIAPKLKV